MKHEFQYSVTVNIQLNCSYLTMELYIQLIV